ncbi:maleylacetoacetate isomerase [Oceanospirillum sediminis]|uniref:Maleylacetoacetate isomerase n=1 Tax=Oceanospirillum sediminis TaxID=2760088 RepID=A0A839INF9_9GAMM|nr:maleylacetoacetate isomerase [Oceanospirillum sediminis]MBB1486765.1 maleylacetoacetate isomerase [Oceanospirillum sediminis]
MQLFDYFRSSASYRVRIALNLKGIDCEQIGVNLLKGEHKGDEHLSRNPQGFVPALALDSGEVLTQSLAIIEYLEEVYPDRPVLPTDAAERARVRSLAQLIACDIHPVDNLRVLKYLTGELGISEEQKTRWYQHWIEEGFAALESRLSDAATGQFCHGDTPTLADICLAPQVFNAQRFNVDLTPFPHIMAVYQHAEALDAFRLARPENQPDAN